MKLKLIVFSIFLSVSISISISAQNITKTLTLGFEDTPDQLARISAIKRMLSAQKDISKLPEYSQIWNRFEYTQDILANQNNLSKLGFLPHKKSSQIADSPIGIGFETLDRDTFDPTLTFDYLGDCGVKLARCQTGWMKCEKVKGKYDFKWLDEVVDGLAAKSIETWFSVSFGNPLYTPCEEFDKQWAEAKAKDKMVPGWARGWVGELPFYHGEKAMKAWLNYVTALAKHFKGRVRIFEIWNEPEWFGRYQAKRAAEIYGDVQAAKDFSNFVKITAEAIRKIIPDARFTINFATLSGVWPMVTAQEGLPDVLDFICYHDYNRNPEEGMSEGIKYLKAWYRKSDGTPVPVWQGESGRSSGKSGVNAKPSEYSQAKYISRRLLFDLGHDVVKSSIFTVTDFLCYYEDGRDQYYGIWSARDNRAKHGYYTLQWLCSLLEGAKIEDKNYAFFTSRSSATFMSLKDLAAVEVVSLERKGVPMFAIWQKEHIDINPSPVKGILKYMTGIPSKLPHPIIIDPVRGTVWDASAARGYYSNAVETMDMWAVDYPLILTDISIFDDYIQ